MAGLTHCALRELTARHGGVGVFTTEMLSARSLRHENPAHSPYLRRAVTDRPLCYQILASTGEEVGQAAAAVERFGADAVDINFGCPAPAIRKRGGGSRLMEDPETAAGVVGSARRATKLPLSAKIRLGETLDEGRFTEFCAMLEAEGVDLITVHARLRGEPYGRPPRWEWIGRAKSAVRVPVVGNGGIFSPAEARACLAASGCDGLMVGRGAAMRPWVVRDIAREVYGAALPGEPVFRPAEYRRFLGLLEEGFLPERRLGRLKRFTHYFASDYTYGHVLASRVQSARSWEQAAERAECFFRDAEPGFTGWEAEE
jgi:nifR3 family TIM-barrel protein